MFRKIRTIVVQGTLITEMFRWLKCEWVGHGNHLDAGHVRHNGFFTSSVVAVVAHNVL